MRDWFRHAEEVLPGLNLTPVDVASVGPPWNTRVFVRLEAHDDTGYRNVAVQWIRLRWGRMVEDWVLEDTLRLSEHLMSALAADQEHEARTERVRRADQVAEVHRLVDALGADPKIAAQLRRREHAPGGVIADVADRDARAVGELVDCQELAPVG
jgi:hypothetical protein